MYIGMDTHKRYSQVAIMDTDGSIVHERRLEHATDFTELEAFAAEFTGIQVAIEATGHYRPIYKTLDDHMAVTLVHPSKTWAIAEAKVKNDRLDTKLLAHLLRTDLLAESYVPPKEIRQQRDLTRTRKALVEDRTREKNRVRAVLARTGNDYESDLFGPTGERYLDGLSLEAVDRMVIDAHRAVIEALDDQITTLDKAIEEIANLRTPTQLLMTIPGISYYSSLLTTAEIGEIDRFPNAKKLVSYAGLDPTVRQSGDRELRGGIS